MLLIIGTLRLPKDAIEDARPAMARMIEGSRAEVGCLHYSYAQDMLDPALIHVKELWRSRAHLDAHFASAHLSEWRAAGKQLGIFDRNLVVHEVGEGEAV